MGKEDIAYLSPGEQDAIESWTTEIGPIVETTPQLREVGLVVEGGVGRGSTMPDISKFLFPRATYVGTELISSLPRLRGSLDQDALDRIRTASATKDGGHWKAMIHANCFDYPLIRDLLAKLGKQSAALVSFNGLNALLSWKDLTHFDKKNEEDRRSLEQILSPESPYMAQLHFGVDWEDNGQTMRSREFFRLEAASKDHGWEPQRFDAGLLLTRAGQ